MQRAEASGHLGKMMDGIPLQAVAEGRSEEQRSTGKQIDQLCHAIELRMSERGPLEPGAVEVILEKLASMRKTHVTVTLMSL